jgi:hypothetical protein
MKKSLKKILATVLLSATMVSSLSATTVFAKSTEKGNLNGVACSGSIAYVKTPAGVPNGVKATTAFGPSAKTIKATAVVCYKSGNNKKYIIAKNSDCQGATSATASTNDVGNVYGGRGHHYIKFGAYSWEEDTYIGTVWDVVKKLEL